MKTKETAASLLAELEATLADPPAWDALQDQYDKLAQRTATVEMPLGEVMNGRIAGFVWAWRMQGKIKTAALTGREGFAAQGLEGKAVVEGVNLVTALLVLRELGKFRCRVLIDK